MVTITRDRGGERFNVKLSVPGASWRSLRVEGVELDQALAAARHFFNQPHRGDPCPLCELEARED